MKLSYALLAAAVFAAPAFAENASVAVDAREAPRKILHVNESIPVKPGALTLLYPKWLPGEHAPDGTVVDVAGLKLVVPGAGGEQVLAWRRDLENMFAIHTTIPAGVTALQVRFDFLLPTAKEGFSSAASASDQLAILSWNQVTFYPADAKADDWMIEPAVRLPAGWQYGTALRPATSTGGESVVRFQAVSLANLVDSPVLAAAHMRHVDLGTHLGVPHVMHIGADSEAALAISPESVKAYSALVREETGMMGARHYDHYDFLLSLSEHIAWFGLEHHASSDNRRNERMFLDDDQRRAGAGLLPHEMFHSWNGKYRRPSGLATGDYSTPMKGELLWVYEGLTTYYGDVMTARAGLLTPEEWRSMIAYSAANMESHRGRTWRPLQDTADDAQQLYGASPSWEMWRRRTDFYEESALIWLEADVKIRELTKGKKSLDDFCRRFHGGENSAAMVKPYGEDDVYAALNEVAPMDWKKFFRTRLDAITEHAPMAGLEGSGWKFTFHEKPGAYEKAYEAYKEIWDLRWSLGVILGKDGAIKDLMPDSPAAAAGLTPGMQLVAVNGRKYTKEALKAALAESQKDTAKPVELLATNNDYFHSYAVNYHGGERYAAIERNDKPDVLGKIAAARFAK